MRLLLLSMLLTTSPSDQVAGGASGIEDQVREEIVDLHRFFEGWFNGTLNQNSDFERLEAALAPGFILISPGGSTLPRDTLLTGLKSAYGRASAQPMRIEIRNVEIREHSGDRILATYEEWQWEGSEEKARISTVLLKDLGNGRWRWLHVHETWLPSS